MHLKPTPIALAAALTLASPGVAAAQLAHPSRPVSTARATRAHAITGDVFTARVHGRRQTVRVAWLDAPDNGYAWQHLSFFVTRRDVRLHIFGRTASGALLARVTWHRHGLTRAMVGIRAGTLAPLAWEF